jgi:hypothetical protein
MIEQIRYQKPEQILTPVNTRAWEQNFKDEEIFGVTNDLPIVLNLFRKEGLTIPDRNFQSQLRGDVTTLLAKNVSVPPLYLHRCRKNPERVN